MSFILFHSERGIRSFFKKGNSPIKLKANPHDDFDNNSFIEVNLYFKDDRKKTKTRCFSGADKKSFYIHKNLLNKKKELIL